MVAGEINTTWNYGSQYPSTWIHVLKDIIVGFQLEMVRGGRRHPCPGSLSPGWRGVRAGQRWVQGGSAFSDLPPNPFIFTLP